MKKFLRSLTAMAACAAMLAACSDSDDPTPGPDPDPEGQKANTWVFNDGEAVEMGSVMAMELEGNVYVFFSAEKGLAEPADFGGAADMTQIIFPASLIGGEVDLTAIGEDDITQILSLLPEFGEQYGFMISGYDKTVSEGKLAVSLADDVLSVKCEFAVLDSDLRFSAYVQTPFTQNEQPDPETNFYDYGGNVVALRSAYAFGQEEGDDVLYGMCLTPTAGLVGDEVYMEDHQLAFMVNAASMYEDTVFDMETGVSTFDVRNLPDGCMLNLTVSNGSDLYLSVPDDSVSEGEVAVSFANGDDGGFVINVAGNVAFNDGNVLKFNCSSPLIMAQATGHGFLDYYVESRGISESATFLSGFYHQSTWDEGMTFTYSVSETPTYLGLGGNAFVEIYVGSEELLNGEAFDVATTNLPFSFQIEYLDRENQTLVPVKIDNANRAGASGYITFVQNVETGLYDSSFNLFLNNGDITVSGNYAGELSPRNVIYSTANEGPVAYVRSATLDLSADPCVLYLSSARGTAGPDQFDIKCEVPAAQWRYDFLLSFSGSDAAITWDDVRYDSKSTTDKVIGGNWKVSTPVTVGGSVIAECQTTLFGMGSAYYYGEMNIIQ